MVGEQQKGDSIQSDDPPGHQIGSAQRAAISPWQCHCLRPIYPPHITESSRRRRNLLENAVFVSLVTYPVVTSQSGAIGVPFPHRVRSTKIFAEFQEILDK